MNNFDDFEDFGLIRTGRNVPQGNGRLVPDAKGVQGRMPTKGDKMTDAVRENFGRILDITQSMVDIKRMKVQSDAVLKKMAEDRRMLVAEAEAYAKKKNADTKSVVDRMNVVRLMMKDFYDANSGSITSEDFRIIITETINQMGRMQ